jgi:hypothetical protein
MGSVDHGACLAPYLFMRHIPAPHRIAFRGYAFVYFQLAQIETVPKHEAQHCLRSAPRIAGEFFKAALLRRGKCQGSHAASSSVGQHERLYHQCAHRRTGSTGSERKSLQPILCRFLPTVRLSKLGHVPYHHRPQRICAQLNTMS